MPELKVYRVRVKPKGLDGNSPHPDLSIYAIVEIIARTAEAARKYVSKHMSGCEEISCSPDA